MRRSSTATFLGGWIVIIGGEGHVLIGSRARVTSSEASSIVVFPAVASLTRRRLSVTPR